MHRQSKDKKSANLVWTEKPAKFGLDKKIREFNLNKKIREFSLNKKIREVEGGGCFFNYIISPAGYVEVWKPTGRF
jgi:hypothetical protein